MEEEQEEIRRKTLNTIYEEKIVAHASTFKMRSAAPRREIGEASRLAH